MAGYQINYADQGWPHWIWVNLESKNLTLRSSEVKKLIFELQEALSAVEKLEQLDHYKQLGLALAEPLENITKGIK